MYVVGYSWNVGTDAVLFGLLERWRPTSKAYLGQIDNRLLLHYLDQPGRADRFVACLIWLMLPGWSLITCTV